MEGPISASGRSDVRAGTSRSLKFAYGGVAFEVLVPTEHPWQLPPRYDGYLVEPQGAPVAADVVCSMSWSRDLPPLHGPDMGNVRWRVTGDGGMQVYSSWLSAELTQFAPGRYLVRGRMCPEPEGPAALVRGIAAAIVHLQGGLNLHCSGVELDGKAVLFVGPSGAGKSTARSHLEGRRPVCDDHASIVRTAEGWQVWGVPNAAEDHRAPSSPPYAPLAAVLRVRQASDQVRLEQATGVDALFALRESCEFGDFSPQSEAAAIQTLLDVLQEVPCGQVHTVLGQPLEAPLRGWLRQTLGATE